MSEGICTVSDCEKSRKGRLYCAMHEARLRKSGSLDLRPRLTEVERFWSKVDKSGDCWLWRGAATGDGYGVFVTHGRHIGAHRWAYEALIGPIPDGLYLDHLCRTPPCVNPAHLEPVTNRENLRRAFADQTECKYGHPLDSVDCYGRRYCGTCVYRRTRTERGVPKKGYMFLGHTIVTFADATHGCRCGAYSTRTLAEAKVRQRAHRLDLARERGLID